MLLSDLVSLGNITYAQCRKPLKNVFAKQFSADRRIFCQRSDLCVLCYNEILFCTTRWCCEVFQLNGTFYFLQFTQLWLVIWHKADSSDNLLTSHSEVEVFFLDEVASCIGETSCMKHCSSLNVFNSVSDSCDDKENDSVNTAENKVL